MHTLIRPPAAASRIEKFTGTSWVPDDGRPGIAFSALLDAVPVAYHPVCSCDHGRPGSVCPSELAMQRTVERFGAGNGVGL